MFLSYLAVAVGVRGLTDLASGRFILGATLSPMSDEFASLMAKVFAYGSIGVVAACIGYWLPTGRLLAQALPRLPSGWTARRAGLAAVAAVAISTAAAFVYVARLGSVVITHPSLISVRATAGMFWLFPLMRLGILGFCLLYLHALWERKRVGVGVWILLAVLSGSLYLLTSSKSWIAGLILTILVFRHYCVKPIRLPVLLLISTLFLLLVPVFYAYRAYGFNVAEFRQALTFVGPWVGFRLVLGRAYLADSFAAILYQVPRVHEFALGSQWKELLIWWVPRAWWPEKPESMGLLFGPQYLPGWEQSGSSFLAPSLIGDLYLNFGLAGIVLGLACLGTAFRLMYEYLIARQRSPAGLFIYAVLLFHSLSAVEMSFTVLVETVTADLAMVALLVAASAAPARDKRVAAGLRG